MTLGAAPEMASYQDEPPQMRSGMPGKRGKLLLGFERRGPRTAMVDMYRQAPLLVQRPLYWDEALPDMACVFLIHTSGSVLQGDRFDIDIRVAAGARAHVTTQTATNIHVMEANHAAQSTDITLAAGSYLEYMPGVIIPHRHARYISRTRLVVPDDATFVSTEALMAGRKYHGSGELFEYDVYSSSVIAQRPDGTPLFSEKLLLQPALRPSRAIGSMGAFDVMGSGLVLTPHAHIDAILDQLEASVDADGACAAGASRLPNDAGVVYRVLGMETGPVRSRLREFWRVVRRTVTDTVLQPEFLWR